MKLAIMQPYFLPYIGYFQLIAAVDKFIVYDNIKYTKKGWINRNRFLQNGQDVMFSLPLKNASDYLDVCDRELATDFNREKLLNQFKGAYRRAPYFDSSFPVIEEIIQFDQNNLFEYLHHSIVTLCKHLEIKTQIVKSSEISIDHTIKNQDKVLALCKAAGAQNYINAIGGQELYSKEMFNQEQIALSFIKSKPFVYTQGQGEFVPWLSILDVLMFNPLDKVCDCIASNYELI
jgi:hypothetical protein